MTALDNDRDEVACAVSTGCGCYTGLGLCQSCRIAFDALVPVVADMRDRARQEGVTAGTTDPWTLHLAEKRGADKIRAAVETVITNWALDDSRFAVIQAITADLRTALDGGA